MHTHDPVANSILLVGTTAMYSTGHWIGGTVLLVVTLIVFFANK